MDDRHQKTHPSDSVPGGPPDDSPPEDPKYYELVIDNDSGTYRPDANLLPVLQKYLEKNFPGLRILTKACDDDELKKIKEEQKKAKMGEGGHMVFGQGSETSSISSSDESDLEDRAQGKGKKGSLGQGFSAVEDPKGMARRVLKAKGRRNREKRAETVDSGDEAPNSSTKKTDAEAEKDGGEGASAPADAENEKA